MLKLTLRAVFWMALVILPSSVFASQMSPCLAQLSAGKSMAGCPVEQVIEIQQEYWHGTPWRSAKITRAKEYWLAGSYSERDSQFILPVVAEDAEAGDYVFYTENEEKGELYFAFLLAVDGKKNITHVNAILRSDGNMPACTALAGAELIHHGVRTNRENENWPITLKVNHSTCHTLAEAEFDAFIQRMEDFHKNADTVVFLPNEEDMAKRFSSVDAACAPINDVEKTFLLLTTAHNK